jgi:hypothetical protein
MGGEVWMAGIPILRAIEQIRGNRQSVSAFYARFSFDTHIFKEGDTYVAYVPALNISS